MIQARLNLAVALPAEARAINQLLGLHRVQPDRGAPLYAGHEIALVMTGQGLDAMQAGVRHLQGRNGTPYAGWMNIGIAGHAELPLGRVIMASRVIDPQHQRSWELPTLPCPDCTRGQVQTVAAAVTDYPDMWVYDMEAAGFVATALEFAPLERIRVVKIISDNRSNPTRAINAKMVRDLMQQQSSLIRQLVNRMQADYDPLSAP